MKRVLSIITIMTLLFTFMVFPVNADDNASIDLQKAIEITKEKLNLDTEGFDFSSSYSENYYDGRSVWQLNWYDNAGTGISINVSVDASTGEILSYYTYGPYVEPTSKLPKYTKAEALKAAEEFLNNVCPDKTEEIKLVDNPYDNRYLMYNDYYNFNYTRIVNGIEFNGNSINIGVDKNTLEVKNFNVNWDMGNFPEIEKAMTVDEAKKIFADKQGLQLTYQLIKPEGSDKQQAVLVYTLKGNQPIDAITGELLTNSYYYPMYNEMNMKMMETAIAYDKGITPEEQKEIDDTSKYISKEEALESVREYLPEIDKYMLSNANLYPGYDTENATWNLSWNYNDDKGNYIYISATVDAVTTELKSFYKGGSDMYQDGKDPKITEDEGQKIAEAFLNKIQPEKFTMTKYQQNENNFAPDYKPAVYYYNFVRTENDILCPFNSLYVSVSAYTGEIVSYSYYWIDVELPAADNLINIEKAYETMYSYNDLKLAYIKQYNYKEQIQTKPEIKLAYVYDGLYGMIDAKTGTLIDYSGKPYEETLPLTEFTDIEGNKAEADIKLLTEVGVIPIESSEFKPDDKILQKDFIKFLVNAIQPTYYYPVVKADGENDEYSSFYDIAIQNKIISEREKNPDGYVNRQEASKMFVRALGFGFLAEKSNLFLATFNDAMQVGLGYRGYVVIAKELGIFNLEDNKFAPKDLMTRGDAATAIVRYLKTDTSVEE